jgi:N-acetylated-alpha-linked acidic dipeptidase
MSLSCVSTVRFVILIALGAVLSAPLARADDDTIRCWPPAQRPAQAALESSLLGCISTDRLRAWHDVLASEPHIAGSEGDLRTVERIAAAFRAMGLDVQEHEFWPYLCEPRAAVLEIVEPVQVELVVREDILAEDPYTANPQLTPGWNAFSGSGDVTAEVVYANYGTKADFEKLASLGIDARGKIVLARYGGNYRGYKARFAELAGAAGLIIYTDPADSGYCKGIMYPEGGYANESCIQRGSIVTLGYPGDPLTPFIEATKDAPRLDPEKVDLPRIPVQPVGWASAQQIIARMKGPAVPDGWQGGVPFAYRLSSGSELKVRLKVEQERRITRTLNVIGTLRGSTRPDQMVIVGCHHDAWGYGAADPLAGTIALMEAARCISEAAKAGWKPERSIVFGAWGAEEFGIIGSTEWVEANRAALETGGIAYLNLDMASMGLDFGSSASPSLRTVITDAARVVPQAGVLDARSVLEAWCARAPDPALPGTPKFGDLGGGSDHVGFLCHAGIASASLSAGGSQGTSYHSTYDNLAWYRKVVGEDYQSAQMIARMTAVTAVRLAGAPLLPLDFAPVGDSVAGHLDGFAKRLEQWSGAPPADVARERAELNALATRARALGDQGEVVRQRLLAAMDEGRLPASRVQEVNSLILAMDRVWLAGAGGGGVPGRPWYRNTCVATDEDSGYASWVLPLLCHAFQQKDAEALRRAIDAYAAVLQQLSSRIEQIDALLR